MESPREPSPQLDEKLEDLQPDALVRVNSAGLVESLYPGQNACRELFRCNQSALHVDAMLPSAFSNAIMQSLATQLPHQLVVHEISWKDKQFELTSVADDEQNLRVRIRDISPYKAAENTMRELAYHDGLTGLANRSFFSQNFESSINKAKKNNKHVCVLFIDLDRFKRINDTLGHSVGDELLVEVAERLRRCIRSTDLMMKLPNESVARLGGDEFTIVAADLDSTRDVKKLARRLLESLSRPVKLAEHELVVTPSIGISVFPSDGQDVDTLLKNADAAMYHAKNKGRNNFQFFNHAMNDKAHQRLKLESHLRSAIQNGDLHLEYQPQIDLNTLKVVGLESLARWHHKELGVITPDVFIPIAEESGLISPLGDLLLELGFQQLKTWDEQELSDFRLAMNFSGLQFRHEHIVASIQGLLAKYDISAHRLELEITEGVIARDPEQTLKTLNALRELGIKLTIDDFGTGYSSLLHLNNFPLDALKIDKLFTEDIRRDEKRTTAVADAILAIANQLGLEVIAEGVETQTTLDYLRSKGCKAAQGYLISRPMAAEDCTAFLHQHQAGLELENHTLLIAH